MAPLRVGMVPEHFMSPFHWAVAKGTFARHGVEAEAVICPRGTAEMCDKLRDGSLDAAICVTEGLVADVCKRGKGVVLLQSFTETPITLGVWTAGQKGKGVDDVSKLRGQTFGVSRLGSNSHLNACFFALSKGWTLPDGAKFHVSGKLSELIRDVNAGTTDAFLWEKLTTTPHEQRGEVRRLADFSAPWHAFTIATSSSVVSQRRNDVIKLCKGLCAAVREFRADPEAALTFTHKMFPQQPPAELRRAVCGPGAVTKYGLGGFPEGNIDEVIRHLRAAGQLTRPRSVGEPFIAAELFDPALADLQRRASPAKL